MTSSRRVAITGVGIVSPLGIGFAATREAVRAGVSGIGLIRRFDTTGHLCRIAAEARDFEDDPRSRDDRFVRLALAAAEEASAQSSIDAAPERIGVITGTGFGGAGTAESAYRRLFAEGRDRLPPMTIPAAMYNAATSAVARRLGAEGPAWTVVSACASATHAIGQAADSIRNGRADVMITGGSDAPITPANLRGWEALRILAREGDDPSTASRPFASDRTGLVLGEGAAMLVLESLDLARKRGATILGEIAGFGFTSDAGHPTDPSVDGATRAIRLALDDAAVTAASIGYISAHGTGTTANDASEAAAIHAVFGERGSTIPVSSTKALHGHAMGATGAIEIVATLAALSGRFLPWMPSVTSPDASLRLDLVTAPRAGRVRSFLKTSLGFGGLNAALIIHVE